MKERVGPGQHATAPAYARRRRDGEAKLAREAKHEERLARKAAKPPKTETAAQKFEKKIRGAMSAFRERRKEGTPWTKGQLRHHEAEVRRKAQRVENPDYRKATRAPFRRWKRKVRARLASASRRRNRR